MPPPSAPTLCPVAQLLLIDRAEAGSFLPEGQGVGLARKIGNDVALRLRAAGRLASPWLHNTDADTLLTRDYFEQTAGLDPERTGAAIYFFEHRFEDDPDLALAARLYEISLRYYVLGLAWAGSPYAYQSMGSCLAIPSGSYAKVRGFPRKNAAEDFYVLDKLAKVGVIERLAGTPLSLEGRPSDRVPFGTGRALRDLTGKRRGLSHFRLYHPLVFAHIAAWLQALDRFAGAGGDVGPRDGGSPPAESLLPDRPAAGSPREARCRRRHRAGERPVLRRGDAPAAPPHLVRRLSDSQARARPARRRATLAVLAGGARRLRTRPFGPTVIFRAMHSGRISTRPVASALGT